MTVNSYTNIVRAMLLTFQNNLIDLFKQNPKIMRSPKKKFLEYAGELHIIVLREEKMVSYNYTPLLWTEP